MLNDIKKYYTSKLIEFGATSKGVDWNTEESQKLRFEQLLKLIPANQNCSLLDYGCGYGALANSINNDFINYTGFDISTEMINAAKQQHPNCTWVSEEPIQHFDYVIASGLFNVKLNFEEKKWKEYILSTLHKFNKLSTKGFAFNVLTSYSDKEKQRSDLHYANCLELFDYCKTNFSKYVSLIHDYPLYEFTILVKKA